MIGMLNMKQIARPLALVLALSLVACGGDDDSTDSTDNSDGGDPASAPAAEGDAGAVTVEHHYGTTTLDAPPERIVSLDTQWTDVLVALDAPLAAAALDPLVEGGRYPWQADMPASVEDIPVTDTIPYEAVAAAQPDLIVVTWAVTEEPDYERLSEIAPTIPLLGDGQVDTWQDIARTAGDVLGIPDRAEALVTEADQRSAELAAEIPGLDGKTYALASYTPGDVITVVADPDDGAATVFAQLGLQIDPDLLALADAEGAVGRFDLSLERIDELDADLLVLLTNGADPDAIAGYGNLPAVQDGAVALLDLAAVTGLNTPTPLSIPYSLERIQPALEAAAT